MLGKVEKSFRSSIYSKKEPSKGYGLSLNRIAHVSFVYKTKQRLRKNYIINQHLRVFFVSNVVS